MGAKFLFDDDKQTPEVLTSSYLYPAQKKMIQFEVRHWCTNQGGRRQRWGTSSTARKATWW